MLRSRLVLPALAVLVSSAPAGAQVGQGPAQPEPISLVEATIGGLRAAMEGGLVTAEGLVSRYLLRANAYDLGGGSFRLRALIQVHAQAIGEARARDLAARQGAVRGPLFGIPVLLKDNIDALPMPTTAGSVALAISVPPDDAFIVARLRAAGAVVLGKSSLTEFANFMSNAMPNGYSSLGGFGLNPYDPRLNTIGQPIVTPGGSSSGSGIAASANLCVVAIGTETSGSILSPANENGVVGIKPTLGLVSRDGIVPITADQDTAGPLARTVEDAARVLGVIAGYDPSDPATAACLIPGNCYADYTRFLDRAALRGARIAIPRSWWGGLDAERLRIMNEAIATMRAQGAVVVDPVALNVNLGGIAISYPPPVGSSTVLIYGMKRDLNRYLASLGPNAPRQSLTQIIAFNNANAAQALRFGQSILVAADLYNTTPGSPDEVRYLADRQRDLTNSRAALDGAFAGPDGQPGTADDFDALLFPSWFGADTPARAGYPSIAVPAGFVVRNRPLPFCATFCGRAFSEPRLIALAYAFEQAKQHRASSRFTPALPTDAIPLSFPEVARLGSGCQGTGGVPEIGLLGSPIAGNSALAVEVSQLAASSTAFLGISAAPGSGAMIGACVLHAGFPFDLQLVATSNAAGTAEFPVPLPWDPSLGGVRVWLQGGALDAGGAGLGLVALTAGLEVTIGA